MLQILLFSALAASNVTCNHIFKQESGNGLNGSIRKGVITSVHTHSKIDFLKNSPHV